MIAEGFDEPSRPYYFFIERLYKISVDTNTSKELLNNLTSSKNLYLHDCYIRVLGVTGEHEALKHLEKYVASIQKVPDNYAMAYYSIYSIGLLGDTKAVPSLEILLQKSNSTPEFRLLGFPVAVALFLLTGRNNYDFVNSAGETQTLIVTPRLSEARQVIIHSQGRKRTYRELIILDRIFRNPDW
jgi:hypothetical protein